MINNSYAYCLSRLKDLILCKYLLIGAKLAPKYDDVKGIDIYHQIDNIDTKYSSLDNEGFIWFEKNKLEDYSKIKTTRVMLFLSGINEYVDVSRNQILSVINNALSSNNRSICYTKLSENIKYDENDNAYYDTLCYIKYDWIKQHYANIVHSIPTSIIQHFKLAFNKIINMNANDLDKLIKHFEGL